MPGLAFWDNDPWHPSETYPSKPKHYNLIDTVHWPLYVVYIHNMNFATNSSPQVDVSYRFKCRSMNIALWYDGLVTQIVWQIHHMWLAYTIPGEVGNYIIEFCWKIYYMSQLSNDVLLVEGTRWMFFGGKRIHSMRYWKWKWFWLRFEPPIHGVWVELYTSELFDLLMSGHDVYQQIPI